MLRGADGGLIGTRALEAARDLHLAVKAETPLATQMPAAMNSQPPSKALAASSTNSINSSRARRALETRQLPAAPESRAPRDLACSRGAEVVRWVEGVCQSLALNATHSMWMFAARWAISPKA